MGATAQRSLRGASPVIKRPASAANEGLKAARFGAFTVQSMVKVSPIKPSSSAAMFDAAQVNPRSRLVTSGGSGKATASCYDGVDLLMVRKLADTVESLRSQALNTVTFATPPLAGTSTTF